MGLFLCLVALISSYWSGRRSLGAGLAATLTVGYLFGILRARYPDGYSHFMFDAAVLGLYASQFLFTATDRSIQLQQSKVAAWTIVLMAWPALIFLLPMQHPLIQLVGLRAAVLFLPFLFLGARLRKEDLDHAARWMAGLTLVAFAFALLEYVYGVEAFFPESPVTYLIYISKDIASGTAYRIPATFSNAHAYGGVMVATMPFLVGGFVAAESRRIRRLFGVAIAAAATAVFMTGARTPVVLLFALALHMVFTARTKPRLKLGILATAAVVAVLVWHDERLQRFATLSDTEMVAARVGGSLNARFFDILTEYPLGAGLGRAVGTSIPFFLQHLAPEPIGMENEYGRIALEQGLAGLALWVAFILWTLMRRPVVLGLAWAHGVGLMRVFVFLAWAAAVLGTGMLTAIPGTVLLLLQMGIGGQVWAHRR